MKQERSYTEKQMNATEISYSEEEVLEFGKYLLEMSNVLMAEKTDVKMLNLEVVKKLVKDLFDLFKKK